MKDTQRKSIKESFDRDITKANWREHRTYLLAKCPVALYDPEVRACTLCRAARACMQIGIHYLREEAEPKIRKQKYSGTYTLDEAVTLIQRNELHKTTKGEFSSEEISEMFRTHDPRLIEYLKANLK